MAYSLSIDDTPPPIGSGEIVVHVKDRATHRPAPEGTLLVKASMPSMPMGETWHEAVPVPGHPGEYHLSWPFVMAGDWQIQAEFQGPLGTGHASIAVSPGAFALPVWARVIGGLLLLAIAAALVRTARSSTGREQIRSALQPRNGVAILVLLAAAAGCWLLVHKLTAGRVDWNAMSMQMQDYTAQTPVAVQPVHSAAIGGDLTYTGSVLPYISNTIYPRVTGRIVETLYPGDRVTAGQVIVRMDQPDLAAHARSARYAAIAAGHDVMEAENRVQQARDALSAAQAAAQGSLSSVQEAEQTRSGAGGALAQAQSELQAARDDRQVAIIAISQAQAAVRQAQAKQASALADQSYWRQEIPREAALLAHGAVSQDEYQAELAKSQAANAAVSQALAEVASSQAGVEEARARLRQTVSKIQSAEAGVRQAASGQGSQAAKVNEARAAARGSRAGVASALHALELARHEVAHTQAMLQEARANESEEQANLDYLNIRAPESGVVTQRLADPGTVVSPGVPILKIDRIDFVRLQANVSAADLSQIHRGTSITARVEGLTTSIQARVTDVFPAASDTSRTAVVEAVVPNPQDRLRPGQFATLQFHGAPSRSTPVVPLAAVVPLGAGSSGVWLARDGAAHLAPVTLGSSDSVQQQVLEGLKDGDLLIVSGIEGLTEGAPITYSGMPAASPAAEAPASPATEASGGLVAKAGDLSVSLSLSPSPPRAGDEKLQFKLTDSAGAPVKGAAVQVTSEMPSMEMAGPSGAARDDGGGSYDMPLSMGMGGDWRITASISQPGKPSIKVVFNFKVQ